MYATCGGSLLSLVVGEGGWLDSDAALSRGASVFATMATATEPKNTNPHPYHARLHLICVFLPRLRPRLHPQPLLTLLFGCT